MKSALRHATGMSHPDQDRGLILILAKQKTPSCDGAFCLAGDEGFEPPILGPEPSALPLGQSPVFLHFLLAQKYIELLIPVETSGIVAFFVSFFNHADVGCGQH